MSTARAQHTATLLPDGRVLTIGGGSTFGLPPPGPSAELYDPVTGTWTGTGGLGTNRFAHTATLLPNGKVLAIGGYNGGALSSAELFDTATGTWTSAGALAKARQLHTATVLPNGKVLVAGGQGSLVYNDAVSKVELYDSATGAWTTTGAMNIARKTQTATLLPSGKLLITGGSGNTWLANAELFDPTTGIWMTTNGMNSPRSFHTATLLPKGKVLAAGGQKSTGALTGAELFDSASGTWTNTGSMNNARYSHSATLLPNGKVLVAGGAISSGPISSVEIYDPVNETWANTGTLNGARALHTATLLLNGKVLIAGGSDGSSYLSSAELYDPTTEKWTSAGGMNIARGHHTATLLPNGKVLVAGGNNSAVTSSTELYDPVTGKWTMTGSMSTPHAYHIMALLPNGKVVVAGGQSSFAITSLTNSVELYDQATESWTATGSMTTNHAYCTMTLLPDGRVLVAGGATSLTTSIPDSELFDVGLRDTYRAQPQIATVTSPLNLGTSLALTGSGFRGVSEGSCGNSQDSAADYPLVQLRNLESGQTLFLLSTDWQTNSFTSAPVWGFPPGYALATVFVNGIPSTGSVLNISVPVPTATTLTDAKRLTNGACQFCFTNCVGALFGVLASTNPALPLSNWTALGGVTEGSPGQFQFIDSQATNTPRRFYRLRAP